MNSTLKRWPLLSDTELDSQFSARAVAGVAAAAAAAASNTNSNVNVTTAAAGGGGGGGNMNTTTPPKLANINNDNDNDNDDILDTPLVAQANYVIEGLVLIIMLIVCYNYPIIIHCCRCTSYTSVHCDE